MSLTHDKEAIELDSASELLEVDLGFWDREGLAEVVEHDSHEGRRIFKAMFRSIAPDGRVVDPALLTERQLQAERLIFGGADDHTDLDGPELAAGGALPADPPTDEALPED